MPTAAGSEVTAAAAPAPLIRRITAGMAAGDESAFRDFHSAYFDRLLRYLFVVTRGDEDAARDALQETFTRVARHVRPFDTEETFWSWLTLLARHAATDAARKRQRYGALLARFTFFWKTHQAHPDEFDSARLDQMLAEAITRLEPAERALVQQKYFQHATVRELSAQLQLTEKAVESRLARARRALRAELARALNHEAND